MGAKVELMVLDTSQLSLRDTSVRFGSTYNVAMIGMLLASGFITFVLFVSDALHSFITPPFVRHAGLVTHSLEHICEVFSLI